MLLLQRGSAGQQALGEFLADVQNPGSSSYHRWLTPAQFANQFAINLSLSGNSPLASGVFNGDGKVDIAAVFLERTGQLTGNVVVTTGLGNGDGTFGTLGLNSPIRFSITATGNFHFNTLGITIADLDTGGKQDLALVRNGILYTSLGQGDGTFLPSVSTNFPSSGNGTVIVDWNGDGYLDAIASK